MNADPEQTNHDDGVIFAQGLQAFFLRRRLKIHKFETALTESLFQRFFFDWSEVIRNNPEAPKGVIIPEAQPDDTLSKEYSQDAKDSERTTPKKTTEDRLEAVAPSYRDLVKKYVPGPQSKTIIRLLRDQSLGTLLTVPYPEPRSLRKRDRTDDSAGDAGLTPAILEAIARSLGIEADWFNPKDRAHIERVTELDLSGLDFTDITPLKALINLQRLDISNTGVTDIAPIAALTNLKDLWLNNTGVTDIAPIAALTNLRLLFLNKTGVSDIAPIAALINLRRLGLYMTAVTDIGPLAALTNLQRIWLKMTGVTEAQIRDLQRALPDCTIFH